MEDEDLPHLEKLTRQERHFQEKKWGDENIGEHKGKGTSGVQTEGAF